MKKEETYEEMVERAKREDLPLVSQCCGGDMPDYPDIDFCPRCKDHTGVEIMEEEEVMTDGNEQMRDVFTDEQVVMDREKCKAEIRREFPNTSEAFEWVYRLWEYAIGRIKWDTSMDFVCEEEPHLPFNHLLEIEDGKVGECTGAGMPPLVLQSKDYHEGMVIHRMNGMCEQSLDPETFGKWEEVKAILTANRSALK